MRDRKAGFVKIDEEMPFFRDSMPKDFNIPEPSKEQKEWANRTCDWLFRDGPMPEEVKIFIKFMRILHNE